MTVRIWDAVTGNCITTHQTSDGSLLSSASVVFSPDSSYVAISPGYGLTKVWDAMEGNCILTLTGMSGYDYSSPVAFSPDSRQLATASDMKNIKVWNILKGSYVTILADFGMGFSLAFSPDGRHLASSSDDQTVKVWDIATGDCLATRNVMRCVHSLSFDATGSCLYTEAGTFVVDLSSGRTTTTPAPSSPQTLIRRGIGLGGGGSWITWNSDKVLWLPPVYRPGESYDMPGKSAIMGSTIAFACASGRVILIALSDANGFA